MTTRLRMCRNRPEPDSPGGRTRAHVRGALAALAAATLALLSPPPAAAQLNFSLTAVGPQNVAQGRSLYVAVTATLLSGTSPTSIPITVSGLPSGATVSFPDIGGGSNVMWSLPTATTVQINTQATTPLGSSTLTVTVTAGSVSRSVTFPMTVTAPPTPLSRQVYATPTTAPQLDAWKANMTQIGQSMCAQFANQTLTMDQKLNLVFYDAQRVFYNIRDYTGAGSWDSCALSAQAVYRDSYVVPNGGKVPGYFDFPHGIYQSYLRAGDASSKAALVSLSRNAAFGTGSVGGVYAMVSPAVSREVAFNLSAYLLARAVGEPSSPIGEAYVELALGHIDQWFVAKNYRVTGGDVPAAALGQFYTQPFMVGLTAEALIQFYETRSQDPRIPAAIKVAMDWLWANAWDASTQSFWYELYGPALGPLQPGSPAGSPDLSLLIAPAFAWVYKQTGDPVYRDRADAIFAGGVARGCASCDGKHFNQQYRWSFDYLKWRNPTAVAAPTGLSVR